MTAARSLGVPVEGIGFGDGRGTGGDFSVIEQLANLLGAGVGATRVATGDLFTVLP